MVHLKIRQNEPWEIHLFPDPYVLFCMFECRNWRWLAAVAISKLHSLMWSVSVMLSAVFFVERYINANYYYVPYLPSCTRCAINKIKYYKIFKSAFIICMYWCIQQAYSDSFDLDTTLFKMHFLKIWKYFLQISIIVVFMLLRAIRRCRIVLLLQLFIKISDSLVFWLLLWCLKWLWK